MKTFATSIAAAAIALTLGGCAGLQQKLDVLQDFASTAADVKVDPGLIVAASNAFDIVQSSATDYLSLRSCRRTVSKVCREPAATRPLTNAITAGRAARNKAQRFVLDHPDELGPRGLYDALKASASTIRSILSQYGAAS